MNTKFSPKEQLVIEHWNLLYDLYPERYVKLDLTDPAQIHWVKFLGRLRAWTKQDILKNIKNLRDKIALRDGSDPAKTL